MVTIQYVAKLEDGTIVEKSSLFDCFLGAGELLPELEECLTSMQIGETKTLKLPPEKTYGLYDEELVTAYPKAALPVAFTIQEGQAILYETDEKELKKVKVKKEDREYLFLDFNHPLAGKTLLYEITLVSTSKGKTFA